MTAVLIALGSFAATAFGLLGLVSGSRPRKNRLSRLVGNAGGQRAAPIRLPAACGVAGMILAGAVSALVAPGDLLAAGAVTVGGFIAGYLTPGTWARRIREKRCRRIARDLPKLADILLISVESGLNITQAVLETSARLEGPLGDEMRRVSDEVWAGMPLNAALQRAVQNSGVEQFRGLVNALVRAETYGTGLADTLNDFRDQTLQDLRRRAETAIAAAPQKLTLVTVCFYLPALLILVVVPSLIRFGDRW